jgi:uncharacterized protein YukE
MSTPPSSSIDAKPIFVSEDLGQVGPTLNAKAQAIADELSKLKSELAPLQEAWRESQSATYYQDMQNEWDIAADGLLGPNGILGQIAQAMHANWGNYTEAEWSNIATWKH